MRACRRRFEAFFPGGFTDPDYLVLERDYKWTAHKQWQDAFGNGRAEQLLLSRDYDQIAATAVRIESRTNLLFSFEKMALRDAVGEPGGARLFAEGLFEWLSASPTAATFTRWCDVVSQLPRRQTRVLTWPVVTVFGFIARPTTHIFLKPMVTRTAAEWYGFEFDYRSKPEWPTYKSLLQFARTIRRDLADMRPRDMIDIQSFIWVVGSSEYD